MIISTIWNQLSEDIDPYYFKLFLLSAPIYILVSVLFYISVLYEAEMESLWLNYFLLFVRAIVFEIILVGE